MLLQEFRNRLSVLHMTGHPHVQRFQSQIQDKSALGDCIQPRSRIS